MCVIAGALWWRGRVTRAELLGAIGGVLLIGGLVHPPLLKYPSAVWWRFSRALGYVNARILLTMLFSVVLVPLSMIWRMTGKDPLARRRQKWPGMVDGIRLDIATRSITNGCSEVIMSKHRVLSEFWQFLRQEKKYWLVPIVVVFVLFGLLIVFSQSSAVAPFIYTLF